MLQVFVAISQKFAAEKGMGYAKVIHKKREEERRIEKNGQVSEVLKQWVVRCPSEKNEMNKIAHVFLQLFPSFKRDIYFQGA